MWPIIKAWSEGSTLEINLIQYQTWSAITPGETINFSSPPEYYRIKPEPKYRPWTVEEVPVGEVVSNPLGRGLITSVDDGGMCINAVFLSFKYVVENYTYKGHPAGALVNE